MKWEQSVEAKSQGICHTEEECKQFYSSLSSELKAPALTALREITVKWRDAIKEDFLKSPDDWYVPYHLSWGMGIRNFLRERGYGEEYFGTHNLDDIYVYLIEEALGLDIERK
jgi:hypothetical protein